MFALAMLKLLIVLLVMIFVPETVIIPRISPTVPTVVFDVLFVRFVIVLLSIVATPTPDA